ncbi:MAG TPA: hypothetical protein PK357_02515 [Candidatus Pacearchaeota archaeon]|nr:hypothetical protein [Candidatus Pacearchaeota archaeon]
MDEYITLPVKLAFDPDNDKLRPELKRVFKNNIARTLWLGIKQRHITDQYFEANCLKTSNSFEKFGVPKSSEQLVMIINRNFGYGYSKEFIEELFPYISGSKNLEYEVAKVN